MKKMTNIQKVILLLMSLTALCLCILAVALAFPISPTTKRPPNVAPTPSSVPAPTAPPAGPTPLQHWGPLAIAQCHQLIRDRLVSPSSAKFSYEEAYRVNGEPMNYHAVTGIVESQNRLGVLLRSEYRCDLHYLPDDPMVWVLDYLDIED